MHSITFLHRDNNTTTTDNTEHATLDNCILRVIEDLRIKYISTQDKKLSSYFHRYTYNDPFDLITLTASYIFLIFAVSLDNSQHQ